MLSRITGASVITTGRLAGRNLILTVAGGETGTDIGGQSRQRRLRRGEEGLCGLKSSSNHHHRGSRFCISAQKRALSSGVNTVNGIKTARTTTATTSRTTTSTATMAPTSITPTSSGLDAYEQQQQNNNTKNGTKQTHFTVAALEASMVPVPEPLLPEGYTYELHTYPRTSPTEVPSRIKDADIIICSVLALPRHLLSPQVCPNLKLIAIVASGSDQVDKEACRERGIVVCNTPHCNTTSVAEHVVASYFALRRRLGLSHGFVQDGGWGGNPRSSTLLEEQVAVKEDEEVGNGKSKMKTRLPRTCAEEVLGIVGYGGVGKRVEMLARSLGMKVLIAGRKGAEHDGDSGSSNHKESNGTTTTAAGSVPSNSSIAESKRTPCATVLRQSSVVVLCCPRSPETMNLISTHELSLMPPHAVLINVSRGGVVDEPALLKSLQEKQISGAATDVFLQEPASPENSVLLGEHTRDLNLLTTPHVAWCAEETNMAYNQALKDNIRGWLEDGGMPKYPVLAYD